MTVHLPPAKPLKRGKTPEQYKADLVAYSTAMRAYFGEKARQKRERFISLGIRQYTWLAMDVHGCCHVAAKNDGGTFSVTAPPPEGHVGEDECTSPDWCRCIANPVVDFS